MVRAFSGVGLSEVPRAVAIGTFDGVHLGHRHLIGRIVASGLVPTVVTFDPHPRLVLGRAVQMISTLSRRLELLEELGVQDILVVPFTPTVARQSPQDWIDSVLRPIGTAKVVVGANFRFGHRASGTVQTLREHGLEVDQIALQDAASSTRIRALVDQGDVDSANALLGRPIEIEGLTSTSSQYFRRSIFRRSIFRRRTFRWCGTTRRSYRPAAGTEPRPGGPRQRWTSTGQRGGSPCGAPNAWRFAVVPESSSSYVPGRLAGPERRSP